jgi:predicted phage terminase large subunit-like protein
MNKSEDSKHFYANTNGGFRKSVGTMGQITGSGSSFIIIDDGANPKRAASERERQNTIEFYDHTLYSRLNQPEIGVRINIQQRLNDLDLTGHLLATNKDQYEHICIPAELTEKARCFPVELEKYYINNLFWPTRFSKRILDNYLKTLGSLQYAQQVNQLTSPEEGNLVKSKWFDIVSADDVTRDINESPINLYLDTAETSKQEGDSTAIVACFKKDNCLYILDVVSYRKEFYQSVNFIKDYASKMHFSKNSKIKVEPKSSGKSIVSQIRASTGLNIMELSSPKDDKLTRLKSCQPVMESRRVIFINGNYINGFLDELCTFPNAAHDDRVDAFIYAVTDNLLEDSFDFVFV